MQNLLFFFFSENSEDQCGGSQNFKGFYLSPPCFSDPIKHFVALHGYRNLMNEKKNSKMPPFFFFLNKKGCWIPCQKIQFLFLVKIVWVLIRKFTHQTCDLTLYSSPSQPPSSTTHCPMLSSQNVYSLQFEQNINGILCWLCHQSKKKPFHHLFLSAIYINGIKVPQMLQNHLKTKNKNKAEIRQLTVE